MPAFPNVEPEVDFPALATMLFYDGPPFATGLPHYGHLGSRPSPSRTSCRATGRCAGTGSSGASAGTPTACPSSMEMEQASSASRAATSVRAYGVDRFNEACRATCCATPPSGRRSSRAWAAGSTSANDYKTMDAAFMESVWWVFKQLWDKGLVYEDRRVMPFSWRLSTSLSNFEANSTTATCRTRRSPCACELLDGRTRHLPAHRGPPPPGRCPRTSASRCTAPSSTTSSPARKPVTGRRYVVAALARLEAVHGKKGHGALAA
jgi:isoleucyl-tRNA synthetase